MRKGNITGRLVVPESGLATLNPANGGRTFVVGREYRGRGLAPGTYDASARVRSTGAVVTNVVRPAYSDGVMQ